MKAEKYLNDKFNRYYDHLTYVLDHLTYALDCLNSPKRDVEEALKKLKEFIEFNKEIGLNTILILKKRDKYLPKYNDFLRTTYQKLADDLEDLGGFLTEEALEELEEKE